MNYTINTTKKKVTVIKETAANITLTLSEAEVATIAAIMGTSSPAQVEKGRLNYPTERAAAERGLVPSICRGLSQALQEFQAKK